MDTVTKESKMLFWWYNFNEEDRNYIYERCEFINKDIKQLNNEDLELIRYYYLQNRLYLNINRI